MNDRLQFIYARIRERLWIRPLLVCIVSIAAVLLAHVADGTGLGELVPEITRDSIESLLKIMAASMLVIATFAVASMVAAYSSAAGTATPRSFTLVVADDTSQNALSTFIGTFIFSVVALVAVMNGYYDKAGRFTLFALTALAFAIVIVTFVRWVDKIARLGRLGNTVEKVEEATAAAVDKRQALPLLGGVAVSPGRGQGRPLYAKTVGYLQHVHVAALQAQAERSKLRLTVAALPGTFCAPNRPIAHVVPEAAGELDEAAVEALVEAFQIGPVRVFDQDPRFGLVVLSEIASRALSPAVNDPGTAIAVIGTLVRLFVRWDACGHRRADPEVEFDRVAVPALSLRDLFDDAFTGIARDGAGTVEVAVRLQKAFEALSTLGDAAIAENARRHARLALERSTGEMSFPPDLAAVRDAARFAAS